MSVAMLEISLWDKEVFARYLAEVVLGCVQVAVIDLIASRGRPSLQSGATTSQRYVKL